ncbi:MAG: addiction module protein [Verrucomicrobia bacterium]|nr:addiction module protein [Verrucomicrobiota bacterium]MBU4428323.1 addiction module protein [Verrucomicrobiota bacterium]MCG2681094.1 addiction module protein [Kiritimatiellia bacterium]
MTTMTMVIGKMTTSDKLRAIEEIWNDLQRTPKEIPFPAWHGDVLRARETRVQEGASRYGDWNEAKSRIREQTRK